LTTFYEVVSAKRVGTLGYQLVKFSLPEMSRSKRSEALHKVLEETHAKALIEWWSRGSIVNKPRRQFYCILIFETDNEVMNDGKRDVNSKNLESTQSSIR